MILTRTVIEIPDPFNAPHLFGFLAGRSIDGVEEVRADDPEPSYSRTLMLPGGPGAFRAAYHSGALDVTIEARTPACARTAQELIRHIFDVDAPIEEIDDGLGHLGALPGDPLAGIRLPGSHDLHEILVRAIIGQQIAVARARTHLTRLARAFGEPYRTGHPEIFPELTRLFPNPERLATELPVPAPGDPLDPDRILRLPRRSIGAVVSASQACATGRISTDSLTRLPGVGPWTAAYVRMRLLPERDTWLIGDVALVAGAKRLGILPSHLSARAAHRELARISERWRPWRSYAAMRLWAATANRKE